MLRRRIAPEPFAASATGGRACALFGAALAVIAVVLGRGGVADPRGALAVLGFGLCFAVLGIALASWAAGVIWHTGRRGVGRILSALLVAGLVLAYPLYLAAASSRMPDDDDVSTDAGAPPPFSATPAALAARGGATHPEPSAEARDALRRFFPNLQPVMLDMPADQAFDLALKAVQARRWRVVEAVPPRGRFGTGHIDAVATTRLMALPDDVSVRIRPAEGQTRLDIRSASRFGGLDAGENAGRVQSLSDELLDAAS